MKEQKLELIRQLTAHYNRILELVKGDEEFKWRAIAILDAESDMLKKALEDIDKINHRASE